MRWIVLAAVVVLSACQPTPPPAKPEGVKPQAPAPTAALPKAAPTLEADPAPQVPAFYVNSPYKDHIAVAHVNLGRPYALFREFLTTDGWITTESTKCLENVKHSNAQVLCQTVPELLNCSSETSCTMLWVKKDGASVVISVEGNMVDWNNKNANSTLLIKKFTFFGITEKNQEVPDPAARFEEQMNPQPAQAPLTPTT